MNSCPMQLRLCLPVTFLTMRMPRHSSRSRCEGVAIDFLINDAAMRLQGGQDNLNSTPFQHDHHHRPSRGNH